MKSETIVNRMRGLHTGPLARVATLDFVPLLGASIAEPEYELFDDRHRASVEISEMSDQGEVPTLQVINNLKSRLFILDNQEIRGLKQNRLLNVDVLLSPESKVKIPVNCVEAGRWSAMSSKYAKGAVGSAQLRYAKQAGVNQSLKAGSGYSGDQRATWAVTEHLMCASKSHSPTMAMSAAYETHSTRLGEALKQVPMPVGTIGVAVLSNGSAIGIDIFDKSATMAGLWKDLCASYLIEVIFLKASETPIPKQETLAEMVIRKVVECLGQAEWQEHPPLGEGKNLRVDDREFPTTALLWRDVVVHLQMFSSRGVTALRSRQAAAVSKSFTETTPSSAKLAPWAKGRPSKITQIAGPKAGTTCPKCRFSYATVQAPAGIYCNHCGHRERTARE
jgi:hypothetical protein